MSDHSTFLDAVITAERDGDTATAARLLTDDFAGIGPLGFVLPREVWLQRHANGLSYESLSIDDTTTRRYGDTAVTVARWNARGTAGGMPIPEAARVTFVVVEDGDTWKLAGVQFSFIAGTPGSPTPPQASR